MIVYFYQLIKCYVSEPKHAAKVIKNYLQCKKEQDLLEVMVWTPQSPHLNIMECVRKPTSTEDLWLVLQDVWNNLQKLSTSTVRPKMIPTPDRFRFKAFFSLVKFPLTLGVTSTFWSGQTQIPT
ncbi:hypothetical protein AMECASPLE_023400 [Ameca splendens]|uniref:Uncharacterized protein n=1 Tax=Ameca splendens TaxID=208324 RepID=A0ABV0XSZ2_9TELE